MSQFSGYLMASPGGQEVPRQLLESSEPIVPGGPTLRFVESAFALRRWDEFVLSSPVRLGDEPESAHPPYEYQVFVVRGLSKFIVLGPRRRVADYLIQQILDRRIYPNFRRAPIHIRKLIERCESAESEFLITSLHGRFSGPGRALRMMSLYGDDVTDSAVFKEHHELFNFFSCGVGRRLYGGLPRLRPNEEGEITRLANDGFLTLQMGDRRRALEFLGVISFVLRHHCVESWVPIAEAADQL